MNWHYILYEVFTTFFKAAMIYCSYSLTKYFTPRTLRKNKKKATIYQIIWKICIIIFISFLIGGLSGGGRNKSFAFSLVVLLPSLWALWGVLEKDTKLTPEEREELKIKFEKEDLENIHISD